MIMGTTISNDEEQWRTDPGLSMPVSLRQTLRSQIASKLHTPRTTPTARQISHALGMINLMQNLAHQAISTCRYWIGKGGVGPIWSEGLSNYLLCCKVIVMCLHDQTEVLEHNKAMIHGRSTHGGSQVMKHVMAAAEHWFYLDSKTIEYTTLWEFFHFTWKEMIDFKDDRCWTMTPIQLRSDYSGLLNYKNTPFGLPNKIETVPRASCIVRCSDIFRYHFHAASSWLDLPEYLDRAEIKRQDKRTRQKIFKRSQ